MSPTPPAIHAPRGAHKTAKGWIQEAAKRMLMNNLDPEVAEKPDGLIVYGGRVRPPAHGMIFARLLPPWTGLKTMKPCWCNRVSRLGCSVPSPMPRA